MTDFSLGRWFLPVAITTFVYICTVIVIALAPQEGHVAGAYLLYMAMVGALWYVFYLRSRIANRTAGAYRAEVIELEKMADF
jgi:hypothetical protein